MEMLKGCAPSRISENIKVLKGRGVPEREAISQAHQYAKQAKKEAADVTPLMPDMEPLL